MDFIARAELENAKATIPLGGLIPDLVGSQAWNI
jgi:hypothetical protein